ncbi:MAG: NlpC/P60 family protein [Desulfobacteraceae bacterium]|nr:NlpC/P60 family protein [Desulfobacteraceae bacterium]
MEFSRCLCPAPLARLAALAALIIVVLTTGCASHRVSTVIPPPAPRPGQMTAAQVRLLLEDQLASWRGVPYRSGGLSREGVDCSGFVQLTFRDKFGITLPRTVEELAGVGIPMARGELASGDLVFFGGGSGKRNGHVGIVMDGEWFIHASSSRGVIRSNLGNPYWNSHFRQGRRVLPLSPPLAQAAAGPE